MTCPYCGKDTVLGGMLGENICYTCGRIVPPGAERRGKRMTELKSCPFCKHTHLLELWPKDPQRVAEELWDVLLADLYELAKDDEDNKEIQVLDHRIRKFIRATRVKE